MCQCNFCIAMHVSDQAYALIESVDAAVTVMLYHEVVSFQALPDSNEVICSKQRL